MAEGSLVEGARSIHLVGINGAGMSSLAGVLLAMGKSVSGCDTHPGRAAERLSEQGARVARGHSPAHITGADLVIISSAVQPDNPDVEAARLRGLPIIKHARALGELMAGKHGVAVAGTHGKSTTTALVAYLLYRAGLDPTLLGGAESVNFGGSSRLGMGEAVVVEADEYDRRFLNLSARTAVVTSIESDHLDYFADLDEIVDTFRAFLALLPEDGLVVTCRDDEVLSGLTVGCRRLEYGFCEGADYRIESYESVAGEGARFTLLDPEGVPRPFALSLPGRHNAANACAAIVVARSFDVPWPVLQDVLPTFRGTRRRFERVGEQAGVTVVDDYAHHPSAVSATLRAAREWHSGPVWAAFQPHTTNRTAALMEQFAEALKLADRAYVLQIYEPEGREYARRRVSAEDLAGRVPYAVALGRPTEAAKRLAADLEPGVLLLTMGAGDVTALGPMVLQALGEGRR